MRNVLLVLAVLFSTSSGSASDRLPDTACQSVEQINVIIEDDNVVLEVRYDHRPNKAEVEIVATEIGDFVGIDVFLAGEWKDVNYGHRVTITFPRTGAETKQFKLQSVQRRQITEDSSTYDVVYGGTRTAVLSTKLATMDAKLRGDITDPASVIVRHSYDSKDSSVTLKYSGFAYENK